MGTRCRNRLGRFGGILIRPRTAAIRQAKPAMEQSLGIYILGVELSGFIM